MARKVRIDLKSDGPKKLTEGSHTVHRGVPVITTNAAKILWAESCGWVRITELEAEEAPQKAPEPAPEAKKVPLPVATATEVPDAPEKPEEKPEPETAPKPVVAPKPKVNAKAEKAKAAKAKAAKAKKAKAPKK